MRPLGEFSRALHSAATEPGTVRQLCERAQVGYDVGRKTASRMRQRGDLVVHDTPAPARPGPGRPACVMVAADKLSWSGLDGPGLLSASFWEQPPADPA